MGTDASERVNALLYGIEFDTDSKLVHRRTRQDSALPFDAKCSIIHLFIICQ